MTSLKLPRIGFGTWQLSPSQCTDAVLKAIETGYRFIDTAQIYNNESEVGDAIARSPVPRDELIIATKIWVTNFSPGKMRSSAEASLKKLKVPVADVLYLHWPAKIYYKPAKTLKMLAELKKAGITRHIAVSNFTPGLVDEALSILDEPIVANQVEHHPLLQQRKMREYLVKNDMYLVAYSPLARGKVLNVPEIKSIGEKRGLSPTQVSLAWIMNHGAIPIPKATSAAHIKENFDALNVDLAQEEIALIDSIAVEHRGTDIPFLRPKW